MRIKDFMIASIERTQNPLAPIILEEAHAACERLAKLLVPIADKKTTTDLTMKLLSPFPDDMDHISCDPNFVLALAGMLEIALVHFATTKKEPYRAD